MISPCFVLYGHDQEKLETNSNNSDDPVSSISETGGLAAPAGVAIPDYLAREVLKLTFRSAVELEAVWAQVGACFRSLSGIEVGLIFVLCCVVQWTMYG